MTDIVTRLRSWVHTVKAVPASDLMDEAADEIERLRNGSPDGRETVAWAVALGSDWRIVDGIFLRKHQAVEACARRNEHTTYGARVIPLYTTPQTCPHLVGKTTQYCSLTPFTLTDEEREAIRKAMVIMRIHEDDDEDVLEALLERTK